MSSVSSEDRAETSKAENDDELTVFTIAVSDLKSSYSAPASIRSCKDFPSGVRFQNPLLNSVADLLSPNRRKKALK